jgi:hypothetical protein
MIPAENRGGVVSPWKRAYIASKRIQDVLIFHFKGNWRIFK